MSADWSRPLHRFQALAVRLDRQREVVRTAYMGYFEYPKGANAGEVAAALDISRSTFAEHLAAATGKLFGAVLVDDESVTPTAARPRAGSRRTP